MILNILAFYMQHSYKLQETFLILLF
ncbi:unnamed protein product [Spirodela intermedia]|uniref:Uncharacterized protein n=1 Tax=Spirodela intermedia TaxID=51605 RepID=A0A7I8IUZ7_SPIIN|nr:unnamed protein product [Spirodela intermedia]CAA6661393.1 unnamed protein product [Spirodela intermedia]